MAKPLVSIVIPCFNAAASIEAAVGSALNQTWPNIQVIVVDDGSSDGSAEIVQSQFSGRITLVRQENRGASAARNRALQEATGDYIQYLDADDLLHLEKVAMQMRVGEAHPRAVTWCHWQPFRYEPGDIPFRVESAQLNIEPTEYLSLYLDEVSNLPHSCHLIPRAVAERAGPWDERLTLNDDGEYAARIAAASSGLMHAGEGPLYFYRKLVSSLSAANSASKVYSGMLALDKIAALAASRGVDLEQTRLAWKYYALMVSSYPYSRTHIAELEWRVRRYGGKRFKPHLGGPGINRLAEMIGWKAARRLQISVRRLRTSSLNNP